MMPKDIGRNMRLCNHRDFTKGCKLCEMDLDTTEGDKIEELDTKYRFYYGQGGLINVFRHMVKDRIIK